MSYSIVDNFSYNGDKPNFERDNQENLIEARRVARLGGLDEGHIVYCKEEKQHYKYMGMNENDQPIFIVAFPDTSEFVKRSELTQTDDTTGEEQEIDFSEFVKKDGNKVLSTHDLTDELYNILNDLSTSEYPTVQELTEVKNSVNALKAEIDNLIDELHPAKIVVLSGESTNFDITESANINISWKYAKKDGKGINITAVDTTQILLNGVRANSSYTNYIDNDKVEFSISIPAPRQIKNNVFRIVSDTDSVEFNYNFLAPAYFGTISDDFRSLSERGKGNAIIGLSTLPKVSSREAKIEYRLSLNSLIYAYPAVYGELTSIRNTTVGGIEDIKNFYTGTVTLNNNIEYRYYVADINFADWTGNLEEGQIADRSEYITYKFK